MSAFAKWLLSILEQILDFIVEVPLAIAGWLWDAVLSLIGSSFIIGLIDNAGQIFSQISPSVWYFMAIMKIPFGITVVTSAYVLRFLVRRIPFIG
ncbi:DUF2523 family protein [Pseudomonas jessenii]|uniref:DUF2523 family protein n=1 Tax=Pseudomonas jessenii TaxID=77298 RepID=UPI000E0EA923|nr:DUF2523 family protein [Pseudomonas jessenii]